MSFNVVERSLMDTVSNQIATVAGHDGQYAVLTTSILYAIMIMPAVNRPR